MKSNDVRQLDAFQVPASVGRPVSGELVQSQPDFSAALMLAIAASGLADKQVYGPLGIDAAQWSRIRSGDAHFPMTRYDAFAQIVGNDIVLEWLAHRRRYELRPLENDKDRRIAELEQALEQERRDRETILRFVKEARL